MLLYLRHHQILVLELAAAVVAAVAAHVCQGLLVEREHRPHLTRPPRLHVFVLFILLKVLVVVVLGLVRFGGQLGR